MAPMLIFANLKMVSRIDPMSCEDTVVLMCAYTHTHMYFIIQSLAHVILSSFPTLSPLNFFSFFFSLIALTRTSRIMLNNRKQQLDF